ncbi:MAG: ATP-binding protein, partial [Chloroflexi bacterium]|nr:ATP-binding protein [Chloroflexota bacterium]
MFPKIGYQSNPFRSVTDDEWAALAVLPSPIRALADQLERDGRLHVQFIGRKGRGKSTMLRGIGLLLEDRDWRIGFEYVPLGQHSLSSEIADLDALLIDEIQRVWPRNIWRLLRQAKRHQVTLLMGTHLN